MCLVPVRKESIFLNLGRLQLLTFFFKKHIFIRILIFKVVTVVTGFWWVWHPFILGGGGQSSE